MSNFRHVFSNFYINEKSIREIPKFLHVGSYTGEIEKILTEIFPKCTIYSVEPHPDNFLELVKNTDGMSNVVRINKALTNNSQKKVFISGSGGVATTYKIFSGTKVPRITLKEIIEEFSIDSFDCIFYNAEGSEMDFVPYLMESGLHEKVDQLCVNFHVHVESFGISYEDVENLFSSTRIREVYTINDDRVSKIASSATGVPLSERYPCFLFYKE